MRHYHWNDSYNILKLISLTYNNISKIKLKHKQIYFKYHYYSVQNCNHTIFRQKGRQHTGNRQISTDHMSLSEVDKIMLNIIKPCIHRPVECCLAMLWRSLLEAVQSLSLYNEWMQIHCKPEDITLRENINVTETGNDIVTVSIGHHTELLAIKVCINI